MGVRRRSGAVAILVILLVSSFTATASSYAGADEADANAGSDVDDPLEKFEENRKRQAELAAELDALAASQDELLEAIKDLEQNLAAQQDRLDRAQRALADSIVASERAAERYDEKAAELVDLQAHLDEMVVEAFINPPSIDALATLLNSDNPNSAETKDVLRGSKIDFDVEVIDLVEKAKTELGTLAERAADAEDRATTAHEEQLDAVIELNEALSQHEIFVAEVQNRIEADFLEAIAIAGQNEELSAALIAEAEALAQRLTGVPNRNGVPTVDVRGIRVHEVLGPQLELLLTAAAADGIVLGGGGYRSTEQQVSLRRAHCGADNVFTAPPGACSPPTARPGASMHEIGLAIDFTVNGSTISSRSDPAFVWLAAHAHEYGLKNLPSEPWHWSVNGR